MPPAMMRSAMSWCLLFVTACLIAIGIHISLNRTAPSDWGCVLMDTISTYPCKLPSAASLELERKSEANRVLESYRKADEDCKNLRKLMALYSDMGTHDEDQVGSHGSSSPSPGTAMTQRRLRDNEPTTPPALYKTHTRGDTPRKREASQVQESQHQVVDESVMNTLYVIERCMVTQVDLMRKEEARPEDSHHDFTVSLLKRIQRLALPDPNTAFRYLMSKFPDDKLPFDTELRKLIVHAVDGTGQLFNEATERHDDYIAAYGDADTIHDYAVRLDNAFRDSTQAPYDLIKFVRALRRKAEERVVAIEDAYREVQHRQRAYAVMCRNYQVLQLMVNLPQSECNMHLPTLLPRPVPMPTLRWKQRPCMVFAVKRIGRVFLVMTDYDAFYSRRVIGHKPYPKRTAKARVPEDTPQDSADAGRD